MSSLVSVIVPMYKVENYLSACIKNIIYQTYKNLQIRFVDDGSTDIRGLICDKYAKIDYRIKVIHKQRGWLSDARYSGLKEYNLENSVIFKGNTNDIE